MWSQVRRFGLAGDRVDKSQVGARIGELGRVEMLQQMCDCAVGPRVRPEFEIVKVNRLASRSLGFSRVPVSVRLCVAGSPYLLSQRFDRQAVHLLDELASHHFELLDQGPAFLETAGSGVIFKA